MNRIQALFVDDDVILSAAIRIGMDRSRKVEMVGMFQSAESLLASHAVLHAADVIVIDLGLPGMDGVELIRQLQAVVPELTKLVYSISDDDNAVFSALQAGALGYLWKGCSLLDLEDSICRIHAGESPMSPAIARRVVAQFQKSMEASRTDAASSESGISCLTVRERSILELLDQGLIYKEVALSLGISRHTVHSHIKNIYEKLQTTKRLEALTKAREHGWIS